MKRKVTKYKHGGRFIDLDAITLRFLARDLESAHKYLSRQMGSDQNLASTYICPKSWAMNLRYLASKAK